MLDVGRGVGAAGQVEVQLVLGREGGRAGTKELIAKTETQDGGRETQEGGIFIWMMEGRNFFFSSPPPPPKKKEKTLPIQKIVTHTSELILETWRTPEGMND